MSDKRNSTNTSQSHWVDRGKVEAERQKSQNLENKVREKESQDLPKPQ